MKRLLTLAIVLTLQGCENPDVESPEASDAKNRSSKSQKLTGRPGEVLSNGSATAHLEKLEYDIEGGSGVSPGDLIYVFHIVIGNPKTKPLRFDLIRNETTGDGPVKSFYNESRSGRPGSLSEMILYKGDGIRTIATVPERSVGTPNSFTVKLMHGEKAIGEPMRFTIVDGDFEEGRNLALARKASGGKPFIRSLDMKYRGPLPLELLERVKTEARKWKPDAQLYVVTGAKFLTFGNPATQDLSMIEIPEWRFIFVANGEATNFDASATGIQRLDIENTIKYAGAGPALPEWKVTIDKAVAIAAKEGTKVRSSPSLRMFKVNNTPRPVWILPGSRPVWVDALTGDVIEKLDGF